MMLTDPYMMVAGGLQWLSTGHRSGSSHREQAAATPADPSAAPVPVRVSLGVGVGALCRHWSRIADAHLPSMGSTRSH